MLKILLALAFSSVTFRIRFSPVYVAYLKPLTQLKGEGGGPGGGAGVDICSKTKCTIVLFCNN